MQKSNTYRDEFDTFGDFLAAIARVGIDGYEHADPRLEFAAATGLGEAVPSEGGFAVSTQFGADLWQTVYDTGQLLARCGRQPITGDKLKIPAIDERSRVDGSRFGGVRTYWADEADTVTSEKPKYREIMLQPKKLMALTFATDELLADAPALAAWLLRVFGLEAAFQVEDEIVNGSGAGRPLGILNSGAVISIAKESGQAAATVLPANLLNMSQRLWGPAHRTALWLMNNDVLAQIAGDSFSNGSAVITTDARGQRRILSMPVELVEYTPNLGSAGDVILADLSQYLIGEMAPDFLSSIHVKFINNESVFRFRWRVDGQPAWSSPITPKNSSITQSPFVALAARV